MNFLTRAAPEQPAVEPGDVALDPFMTHAKFQPAPPADGKVPLGISERPAAPAQPAALQRERNRAAAKATRGNADADETKPLLPKPDIVKPGLHKDKLWDRGSSILAEKSARGEQEKSGMQALQIALTVVLPGAVSTITTIAIYLWYHGMPVVFTVYFLIALGVMEGSARFSQLAWRNRVRTLFGYGLAGGLIIGVICYYRYWVHYFYYRDTQRYTNIAGSQSADQFADAGMILFTSDTRVDIARGVGYRSATLGKTICIAPVVDAAMDAAEPSSFFAVGIDCCEWRGQFACNDVSNGAARAGLLAPPEPLVPLAWTWVTNTPVLHGVNRSEFDNAIAMARATFGVMHAESPRLLRWAKDPVQVNDDLWESGIWLDVLLQMELAGALLAYGLVTIVGLSRIAVLLRKEIG